MGADFFFSFSVTPMAYKRPQARVESELEPQPTPLLGQHRILNPLHQGGDWTGASRETSQSLTHCVTAWMPWEVLRSAAGQLETQGSSWCSSSPSQKAREPGKLMCEFQSKSQQKDWCFGLNWGRGGGRKRPRSPLRQAGRVPSYSAFCFSQVFSELEEAPHIWWRAICFIHSTYSDVNLHEYPHRHT